jgi:hypothetical protein
MGTRGRKSAAQLAIAPQVVEINRPSGLNVGSPSHSRRSAGMRRRSVHDPTRPFGMFAVPARRAFVRRVECTPWSGPPSGDGLGHVAGVAILERDGAPVSASACRRPRRPSVAARPIVSCPSSARPCRSTCPGQRPTVPLKPSSRQYSVLAQRCLPHEFQQR